MTALVLALVAIVEAAHGALGRVAAWRRRRRANAWRREYAAEQRRRRRR